MTGLFELVVRESEWKCL